MKETIVVAGGCFWGVEEYYKRLKGVISTKVGYCNGSKENPTYAEVCDQVGHVEAVQIEFDSKVILLEDIFHHLFRMIDPLSLNKQANDKGIQYRTGIYYEGFKQKQRAISHVLEEQKKYKEKVMVEVEELNNFYIAEDNHQNYLSNNPTGYCHINFDLIKKEELK